MAQPVAYTPVTSFLTYQATQPWFPGQNIDVELNALKATTDQIRVNLALIQNDDGTLKAGSVGVAQLSPILLALLGDPAGLDALALAVAATAASAAASAASAATATTQAGISTAQAATATTQAGTATTQAGIATAQAAIAVAAVAALSATSTSSLLIATGAKTFVTQSGKFFVAGQFLQIASNASALNFMHGTVTSYTGTSLVMNITDIGGAGTLADWNISISGSQGPIGATGATGSPGVFPIATAGGTADVITATYSPPNGSLTNALFLAFVATAANATTTPTFSPDGLTARTITKKGGSALVAGDIPGALAVCLVEYNLANTRWELVNPASVLVPSNNLSDLTNATTARTNLGLGTAATSASTAFQAADAQLSSFIPQVSSSAARTTVLTDAEKHIFHPDADTTARVWTIDSNANVAYVIGTAILFINGHGAGVLTIAITSDTLRWAPTGATGSRTLAADGMALAVKTATTEWRITGVGLT